MPGTLPTEGTEGCSSLCTQFPALFSAQTSFVGHPQVVASHRKLPTTMRTTQVLLLGLLGAALLPAAMAEGARRLLADPKPDWRAPEGEAANLVGVWKIQAQDSSIFFPGLAWTAFEKLGDKVKPEDIWAASINLGDAETDIQAEAKANPGGPDVKSPDMEIVIVGSNVTTGMWGGMVVFRAADKVLGVQPMYGFISHTTFGDVRLKGTDGTPYIMVDMYYHPETKMMDVYVNNMLKSQTNKDDDVNTAYLASSVFKKDDGAAEQALKDIAAWHAASKKKKDGNN